MSENESYGGLLALAQRLHDELQATDPVKAAMLRVADFVRLHAEMAAALRIPEDRVAGSINELLHTLIELTGEPLARWADAISTVQMLHGRHGATRVSVNVPDDERGAVQ